MAKQASKLSAHINALLPDKGWQEEFAYGNCSEMLRLSMPRCVFSDSAGFSLDFNLENQFWQSEGSIILDDRKVASVIC